MLIMKLFFKPPLQALGSFSLMHPLLKFTEHAFVVIHLQVDKLYSSVPSHLRLLPLPYMLSTSKKTQTTGKWLLISFSRLLLNTLRTPPKHALKFN